MGYTVKMMVCLFWEMVFGDLWLQANSSVQGKDEREWDGVVVGLASAWGLCLFCRFVTQMLWCFPLYALWQFILGSFY